MLKFLMRLIGIKSKESSSTPVEKLPEAKPEIVPDPVVVIQKPQPTQPTKIDQISDQKAIDPKSTSQKVSMENPLDSKPKTKKKRYYKKPNKQKKGE